jgi:hypothetical protein
MRALTLWQPWATLVAVGAKWVETRDWPAPTDCRGPLAIHAAARKPEPSTEAIHGALLAAGYHSTHPAKLGAPGLAPLPRGSVVAIARLDACVPTDAITSGLYWPEGFGELEREFGNYTAGRWAWIFGSIVAPPEPIPAKGFQKLWSWEPPADATWRPVERRSAP